MKCANHRGADTEKIAPTGQGARGHALAAVLPRQPKTSLADGSAVRVAPPGYDRAMALSRAVAVDPVRMSNSTVAATCHRHDIDRLQPAET